MKVFVLRATAFVVAVVLLQSLTYALVPSARRERSFPEMDLLNQYETRRTDILYFGDSIVRWVVPGDRCPKGMDELLQDELYGPSVGVIQHGAYHPEVYREFCRYAVRKRKRPRVVIVPINLRSFSASWNYQPIYRFAKEQAILRMSAYRVHKAFIKPLLLFKAFGEAEGTQEEFQQAPVFDGREKVGTMLDFLSKPENLTPRGRALCYYMAELDNSHRQVQALIDTARILRRAKVRPIFYVSPIDHCLCKQVLGDEFDRRIEGNVSFLRDVLRKEGVDLLDLSRTVESKNFDREPVPTEHVNEHGRRFVATQLRPLVADALRREAH